MNRAANPFPLRNSLATATINNHAKRANAAGKQRKRSRNWRLTRWYDVRRFDIQDVESPMAIVRASRYIPELARGVTRYSLREGRLGRRSVSMNKLIEQSRAVGEIVLLRNGQRVSPRRKRTRIQKVSK